jgi:hypothetical protein
MEKQPETNTREKISKAVFDGLEFIRKSGATNMLDRPMVLNLAREWDFAETADWIESVDIGTYGRLIFQGPEVIENDPTDPANESELTDQDIEDDLANQVDEIDAFNETDEIDLTEIAWDHVRRDMHDLITTLGKQATLTIADAYQTEQMGVQFAPSRRDVIHAERQALIRNLGQASSLWLQLEAAMTEVQRGVGSLQYLIEPENN